MSRLDRLVRGDVAAWVGRSLIRDMTRQLRSNGKRPPTFAAELLEMLSEAAGERLPVDMSAIGHPVENVSVGTWIGVPEAARWAGRSQRHVRRMAAAGEVRARRVGERTWLVELESLLGVLQNREAA